MKEDAPTPHASQAERLAELERQRQRAIEEGKLAAKEDEMLKTGGTYVVDEKGAESFEFSEKQLQERKERLRKTLIEEFSKKEKHEFVLKLDGEEAAPEMTAMLKARIRKNPGFYIENIDFVNGAYAVTPTERALVDARHILSPMDVPPGQRLEAGNKSEYPPVVIDGSLTLDQAAKEAGIDTEKISKGARQFAFEENKEGTFIPVLVRFGVNMTWSEAEAQLNKMGLRPGTLRELLAFAADNPEDPNLRDPIYALGTRVIIRLESHTPYMRLTSSDESQSDMHKVLGVHQILEKLEDFHSYRIVLCAKR